MRQGAKKQNKRRTTRNEALELKLKLLRRWLLSGCLTVSLMVLFTLNWGEAIEGHADMLSNTVQSMMGWRDAVNQTAGPIRVGIQIGHEEAANHPDELASLRASTGGRARGVDEVAINRAVSFAIKERLEAHGIIVDLLPATPPVNYSAALFVSIHADSVYDPDRRGYKSAHFDPPRNDYEPLLKSFIDEAYFALSGLPDDHINVSPNMRYYYAFNHERFRHSVSPMTPAVIVELGYLSNEHDLAFMLHTQRPAAAVAEGILAYLRERDKLPSR